MNKREAKKEAYRIAAIASRQAAETDLINPDFKDADIEKIEDALTTIANGLDFRANKL